MQEVLNFVAGLVVGLGLSMLIWIAWNLAETKRQELTRNDIRRLAEQISINESINAEIRNRKRLR